MENLLTVCKHLNLKGVEVNLSFTPGSIDVVRIDLKHGEQVAQGYGVATNRKLPEAINRVASKMQLGKAPDSDLADLV